MNVLFVCLGNICRSPLAEVVMKGIFRQRGLAGRIESAGCEDYHAGEGADPRAQKTARDHGLDLSSHRARQVTQADFRDFDVIYAMDAANEKALLSRAPKDTSHKIKRLRVAAGDDPTDCNVPDPYYGDAAAFERVYALLERCCERVAGQFPTL